MFDESVDEVNHDEILNNKDVIEVAVHSDFATCEYERNGETAIDRYCEAERWESDTEMWVAKALRESYTSLFRVESTHPEQHLIVEDVLREGKSPLELTDLSLSKSAQQDALLFFRPIRLDEMR